MPEELPLRPPPTRSLILTFAGVGLSFLVATAFEQYYAQSIRQASHDITANAAPSIKHLSAARTELHRLQVRVRDYVGEALPGNSPDPAEIHSSLRLLGEKILTYRELPTFPGEKDLWARMDQGLSRVEQTVDRIVGLVSCGERAMAQNMVQYELSGAVREASDAVLASLEFDATKSEELARQIEDTRSRSMVIAYVLGSLCLLLSIAAGLLTARASRRYSELLRSHHRLMEKRAEELDLFAGRAAHDILSPLNSVSLALEVARSSAGSDPELVRGLADGLASLQRVGRMVNGLLEFARAGADPSSRSNARAEVGAVVDELMKDLRKEAGSAKVELRVERCEDCAVAAAPAVLASILSNLLGNAIKHIGEGPARSVVLRAIAGDQRVRFEVEDTGPGIPPELGEKIFLPYVRAANARQPGFGLGLATVKRLVEAHGGALGFESSTGKGSLFWFELKRAPAAAPAPAGAAAAAFVPERRSPVIAG
jgi:signal transduction histidine kinase